MEQTKFITLVYEDDHFGDLSGEDLLEEAGYDFRDPDMSETRMVCAECSATTLLESARLGGGKSLFVCCDACRGVYITKESETGPTTLQIMDGTTARVPLHFVTHIIPSNTAFTGTWLRRETPDVATAKEFAMAFAYNGKENDILRKSEPAQHLETYYPVDMRFAVPCFSYNLMTPREPYQYGVKGFSETSDYYVFADGTFGWRED